MNTDYLISPFLFNPKIVLVVKSVEIYVDYKILFYFYNGHALNSVKNN